MASQEERDRIMAEYMASVQDDDEEDEGDFMPEGDDDDSSDEEVEEQENYVVLTGSLGMREDRLVYSGTWKATTGGERKFKLKSIPQKLPLHWDASRPTVSDPSSTKQIPRMRTLTFNGFFVSMEGNKIKERDIAMTFTAKDSEETSDSRVNGKSYKDDDENVEDSKLSSKPAAKNLKNDDDEHDGKMPAKPVTQDPSNDDSKMPSDSKLSPSKAVANGNTDTPQTYGVFGRGTNDFGSFEFEGTWKNASGDLVCKKRYVQSGGAAAAASAGSSDDEADDEVDMNELIALHQDAGLPVEELRKRYRGDGVAPNDSGKRQRVEESDEEEFDGF